MNSPQQGRSCTNMRRFIPTDQPVHSFTPSPIFSSVCHCVSRLQRHLGGPLFVLQSCLKHWSGAVHGGRHDLLSSVFAEPSQRESSPSSAVIMKVWHHESRDRSMQFITPVQCLSCKSSPLFSRTDTCAVDTIISNRFFCKLEGRQLRALVSITYLAVAFSFVNNFKLF